MTRINITGNPDISIMQAQLRRYDFATTDDLIEANPIGQITMFGGSTAPTGWLLCDGSAVSRTNYADLLAVIGTAYGVGDGSTTFNLPPLTQRFPLGKATSGTGATLGGTGGAIDATVTIPAHFHGMGTGADLNIGASGSHAHIIQKSSDQTISTGAGAIFAIQANTGTTYDSTQSATHTHAAGDFAGRVGLVTGGIDGNAAMTSGTTNPPFVVVNFIIRYR